MIRWVISVLLIVLVGVVSLHIYLQPNDLGYCLERPDDSTEKCTRADAIVAVSGGDTNARTDHAIMLYKNGWAEKLIFSGAAADKSGPSNAQAMKSRAISQNVPTNDILLDEYSHNTTENAKNSSQIFKDNNIHDVILVTSGYHQRRASLEFDQKAPDVLVRNAPVMTDRTWGVFWWLNPFNWWLAIGEAAKIGLFYLAPSGGA